MNYSRGELEADSQVMYWRNSSDAREMANMYSKLKVSGPFIRLFQDDRPYWRLSVRLFV